MYFSHASLWNRAAVPGHSRALVNDGQLPISRRKNVGQACEHVVNQKWSSSLFFPNSCELLLSSASIFWTWQACKTVLFICLLLINWNLELSFTGFIFLDYSTCCQRFYLSQQVLYTIGTNEFSNSLSINRLFYVRWIEPDSDWIRRSTLGHFTLEKDQDRQACLF